MLSLSTGSGEQVGLGCTGDVMLPSRIEVGKHSRITAAGNQHQFEVIEFQRPHFYVFNLIFEKSLTGVGARVLPRVV